MNVMKARNAWVAMRPFVHGLRCWSVALVPALALALGVAVAVVTGPPS